MATGPSYPHRGATAWRFAANVFVGSTLVWVVLREFDGLSAIWAIAAMVASTDPQFDVARRMVRSRMVNVLVGAAVGLTFLLAGGSSEWSLPLALATTVLVSSYLVRIPTMWRQAPITAALIIASGLAQHSSSAGIQLGLLKVAEVVFGCAVGVGVSWAISRLWPLPATHVEPGSD
ncbi:MAG: FUSC family protein [Ramlibacter sp.]